MIQTRVQIFNKTKQAEALSSGSATGQEIVALILAAPTLGIDHLEEQLNKAQGQAVCVQITIAILLSEMKNRWDARNQPGYEHFKSFFCRYASFQLYCKEVWGYAETRCKQFVKIGRALVRLTHQAQSQGQIFILPASVLEAINLTRLAEDSRLDAWQDYKNNGVPLPLPTRGAVINDSPPPDKHFMSAQIDDRAARVQTVRDIIENLPADSLAPIIASLMPSWVKKEVDDLLATKPCQDDLATMGLRAKHDLANTYHLTGFQGLIGQDLDDFLTEKLNLI